jgi:glycosyltransferase involved in cell wall biosynthesis
VRIAIDFSMIESAGTRVYAQGFLPALTRIAVDHECLVFASGEMVKILRPLVASNTTFRELGPMGSLVRTVWQQVALPGMVNRWRGDVLLAPFDIAPLRGGFRMVLAVRNPMPTATIRRMVPGRSGGIRSRVHQRLSRASSVRAETVFYPTAFASRMLGGAMDVPPEKRRVVFHGTDHQFWGADGACAPIDPRLRDATVVLFVSRLYPQKQPELVIRAFALLVRGLPDSNLKLAMVGSAVHDDQLRSLGEIATSTGVSDRVVFLSDLSKEVLRSLYKKAAVFVLPSLMETFGQPYVEAMACGVPIVAVDTEVAREICGDAARYVTPLSDQVALSNQIQAVLERPTLAMNLRAAGLARAAEFSWDREAVETLELLTGNCRETPSRD